MRPRVYLASCLRLPEPDPDEPLLVAALEDAGVTASVRAWDDPSVDWSSANAVVMRSTWNYFEQRDAFVAWSARVAAASKLFNPPEIVSWNSHKAYLRDLEKRGFAIVPTWFADRGTTTSLRDACASRGWTDVVVKPAVSAGSFSTRRFSGAMDGGDQFLATLSAHRDVMVQPYVRSVDGYGERSMVWIDGALTHAVRKTPRFSGADEQVSPALPIAADEGAFATAVIHSVDPALLYARCDLARNEANQPMIMELELIEPSLFLLQSPEALSRFARAIAARV
jgi:hypothetical protein